MITSRLIETSMQVKSTNSSTSKMIIPALIGLVALSAYGFYLWTKQPTNQPPTNHIGSAAPTETKKTEEIFSNTINTIGLQTSNDLISNIQVPENHKEMQDAEDRLLTKTENPPAPLVIEPEKIQVQNIQDVIETQKNTLESILLSKITEEINRKFQTTVPEKRKKEAEGIIFSENRFVQNLTQFTVKKIVDATKTARSLLILKKILNTEIQSCITTHNASQNFTQEEKDSLKKLPFATDDSALPSACTKIFSEIANSLIDSDQEVGKKMTAVINENKKA